MTPLTLDKQPLVGNDCRLNELKKLGDDGRNS